MAINSTGEQGGPTGAEAASPAQGTRMPRPALAVGLGLALAVLLVEHLIRGNSYWDYSEGVYLFTSRLLLHGADLYGNVVAAQPPPLFAVGASVLAVDDSLGWARTAMGLIQVGTGLLAAVVIWRLTGSRVAAGVAAPLALLTPWAVHEHGSLIPETIAAPLLLGGVLLAPDRRRAPWLGVMVALLAAMKLSYALPALVLILVSADRGRVARWAAGAVAAGIALSFALFGGGLWRDTVVAQVQSGHVSLHSFSGEWAQIGWNLLGLLCGAVLAWRYRPVDVTRAQRRTLVVAGAVAGATLITLLSTWKQGTSLNSLVAAEATLVPLAVAGCVWALRAGGVRAGGTRVAGSRAGGARFAAAVCVAGLAFAVAQGVALVADPVIDGPHLFLRPGSGPSYGVTLTKDEVAAAVRVARACPAGIPHSGTPFVAFVARRSMPADQPDQYLIHLTSELQTARNAIAAVRTTCPRNPPATH